MITIQNKKIQDVPLAKPVLLAICKTGAEDIKEIAKAFSMTEDDVVRYLEKKLLIEGMTVGIAVWAINFIPDVLKDHTEKGMSTTFEAVVFDAIDTASVYVVNCLPGLES